MIPLPAAPPSSVARVVLHRVRVPLVRPHRAAHGVERTREVVLVGAVGDDGLTGWGECDALTLPTYTSEWVAGAWLLLPDLAAAWGAGRPIAVRGHPMAVAALHTALVDLALRRGGRNLAQELGAERTVLERTVVVSAGSAAEVVAAVEAAIGAGAAMAKVKIHPGHDLDVLGAVRARWPELPLAADANGSYDAHDPPDPSRLDALALRYLEQPLAAADLSGSARLAARMETPLALDESLDGPGALDTALALGAVDVVSVKPARVGGPEVAVEMLERCAAAGVAAFVGGMLELGVGRAVAAAVAGRREAGLPTDVGPSAQYVDADLAGPVVVDADGRLVVPTGPGIGVAPDPARLEAATIDRRVVDR